MKQLFLLALRSCSVTVLLLTGCQSTPTPLVFQETMKANAAVFARVEALENLMVETLADFTTRLEQVEAQKHAMQVIPASIIRQVY